MITIPMTVQASAVTIPMGVSATSAEFLMSIGAAYTLVNAPEYEGLYEVTPKAHSEQTLDTKGKLMTDDVTVFKIPYYETSNLFDGLTVFIAEDTNG